MSALNDDISRDDKTISDNDKGALRCANNEATTCSKCSERTTDEATMRPTARSGKVDADWMTKLFLRHWGRDQWFSREASERTGSCTPATSQMLSLPFDLVFLYRSVYVTQRMLTLDRIVNPINRSDHDRTSVNFWLIASGTKSSRACNNHAVYSSRQGTHYALGSRDRRG